MPVTQPVYLDSWVLEAVMDVPHIGDGWVDLSADVRKDEPIVLEYGISGSTPTDRVADGGALTFALDNSEHNAHTTLGYYSPLLNGGNGLNFNIAVRWTLVYDGATTYKFRGSLADIVPTPGAYAERLTRCRALDWMDDAARIDVPDLDAQVNQRSDQLITTLLDAMAVQPIARDIETGQETFPWALDGGTGQKIKVREELQKICMSELGYAYIKGDSTQGGTFVFEARSHRSLDPTTLFTLDNDMARGGMVVPGSRDDVVSTVQIFIHPTSVDAAATTVLYALQTTDTLIAAGETNDAIFGPYRDPLNNDPIGGTATVNPAATTDYLMNSQADGLGLNLTANFTVTATRTGQGVRFSITNGGATAGYITKLQLRGKGIYRYDAVVEVGVIGAYGDRVLALEMPYQTNINTASEIATYLAELLSSPYAHIESITFLANRNAAAMEAAVRREPGDRVAVSETVSGLAGDQFTINSVRLELHPGGILWCTWGLEPATAQFSWLLGVAGWSELGETTTVGF